MELAVVCMLLLVHVELKSLQPPHDTIGGHGKLPPPMRSPTTDIISHLGGTSVFGSSNGFGVKPKLPSRDASWANVQAKLQRPSQHRPHSRCFVGFVPA